MNMRTRVAGMVSLAAVVMLLGGCAGSRMAVYPESAAPNTPMKSFSENGVDLMVPAGWSYKAPAPGSGEVVKATFTKESATITLMCFNSSFLTRDGLQDAMRGAVNGQMPVNNLIRGPYEVPTSGVTPIFEAYAGEVASKGQKVKMVMDIASKWTRGFGCKYGLFAVAPLGQQDALEKDFIAIVRSLKN